MVELRKITITDDNMKECIKLDVAPEQRGFLVSNSYSLGQAYDYNLRNNETGGQAVTYAIYANDTMVGFIMYGYFPDGDDYEENAPCYYLWRFMIDEKYQGKGYGKQAMIKIIEEVKRLPCGKAKYFFTTYEPNNEFASRFYSTLGFVETGEEVDDETVAKLKLCSR